MAPTVLWVKGAQAYHMAKLKRNLPGLLVVVLVGAAFYFQFLHKPSSELQLEDRPGTYEIVTLLPQDAIPAIDDPQFYAAADADRDYTPDELVLGVTLNGESRAYPTGLLSRHEIVNDLVGGEPIAVTW